jgi:hypothetical protein
MEEHMSTSEPTRRESIENYLRYAISLAIDDLKSRNEPASEECAVVLLTGIMLEGVPPNPLVREHERHIRPFRDGDPFRERE